MIDKQQALEIIDKRDFFNDRAGRELWNDKPKEIQDEDIRNAHEEYEQIKEYILNQPKVGEWIPIKENEPSCNGQYLMFVRIYNKYGSEDKYIVADYYDGLFDVYPYIEVKNCEVEVLAWQPLPEPYKGETEMTNIEYYKDEFVYMLNDHGCQPTLCNYFEKIWTYSDCSCCPFCTKDETGCDYQKFVDWLLEEHKEPIKLKKWEYDLLKCYQETKDDGEFVDHYILKEMQYKGHFQGVDYNLTIEEILENCEVIENE